MKHHSDPTWKHTQVIEEREITAGEKLKYRILDEMRMRVKCNEKLHHRLGQILYAVPKMIYFQWRRSIVKGISSKLMTRRLAEIVKPSGTKFFKENPQYRMAQPAFKETIGRGSQIMATQYLIEDGYFARWNAEECKRRMQNNGECI